VGCLNQPNTYCQNSGKCGLNGNCICKRFYFGSQCELTIAASERATLVTEGLSSGIIFLICFLFIVVFPFLLYLFFVICMRFCVTEGERDLTWA